MCGVEDETILLAAFEFGFGFGFALAFAFGPDVESSTTDYPESPDSNSQDFDVPHLDSLS